MLLEQVQQMVREATGLPWVTIEGRVIEDGSIIFTHNLALPGLVLKGQSDTDNGIEDLYSVGFLHPDNDKIKHIYTTLWENKK